jgi:NAD(P)-dependent dehydrogenase (short-subunit alcohol dehydrogenase family)
MKRLDERAALVTGIGKATAEPLASEGAVVVISDVQDDLGEQATAALREGGAEALLVHLDVLVNNAGGGMQGP